MHIFNRIPGANGYNLSLSEEIWLAAFFKYLLEKFQKEGTEFCDLDPIPGDKIDLDDVIKMLGKHVGLFEEYRPFEWHTGSIPEKVLKAPNPRLLLFVGIRHTPNHGIYYRLLWQDQNGDWNYTEPSGYCEFVDWDYIQPKIDRWMIVED